jgi:hypothetical protein
MDCISTPVAMDIARTLRHERQTKAIQLLETIGSGKLAQLVASKTIKEPDPAWLSHFVEYIGLKLKHPESLEEARRKNCNTVAINVFFDRWSGILDRPAELIINCDETHVSSRKMFKVLVPPGHAALKRCADKLPHFSAMCTITATGYKLPPLFIIPQCVYFPEDLKQFREKAYFIAAGDGWMTQRAFLIYAHTLLYELLVYRETLPMKLRGHRFLLTLDGHKSRWTAAAMCLLYNAGLDVLGFPAHCTHKLQPLDVSVNGPVKVAMARIGQRVTLTRNELNELCISNEPPRWLAEKRSALIAAFLEGWDAGASGRNIRSGFEAAGISPLDRQQPLTSKGTREVLPDEVFVVPTDDFETMNCQLATSEEALAYLSRKPNDILEGAPEMADQDPVLQGGWLISQPDNDGTLLSAPSRFHWRSDKCYDLTVAEDGPLYFAYQQDVLHPPKILQIARRVSKELPIVVVCFGQREAERISAYFGSIALAHILLHGKKGSDQEGQGVYREWQNFQWGGKVQICVTRASISQRLHSGRRLLVVHTRAAHPLYGYEDTIQGANNVLVFFHEKHELDEIAEDHDVHVLPQ